MIFLLFVISQLSVLISAEDWDYLMFTQRWSVTACTDWENESPSNKCTMPTEKSSSWIIHGIWPTKIGTDGPWNCNSAIHFDPGQLDPIIDQLKENWTNIEGNTQEYSFWKHEWHKHGTCSANIPLLNSVFNFFDMGLKLHAKYDINNYLNSDKIMPSNNVGYTINDFNEAITKELKVKPQFHCLVDSITKQPMISEVRICLSKAFELIDCDSKNPNHEEDILGDCSTKKSIMYFNDVPSKSDFNDFTVDSELQGYYQQGKTLINLYRLIKFLIWFTL